MDHSNVKGSRLVAVLAVCAVLGTGVAACGQGTATNSQSAQQLQAQLEQNETADQKAIHESLVKAMHDEVPDSTVAMLAWAKSLKTEEGRTKVSDDVAAKFVADYAKTPEGRKAGVKAGDPAATDKVKAALKTTFQGLNPFDLYKTYKKAGKGQAGRQAVLIVIAGDATNAINKGLGGHAVSQKAGKGKGAKTVG
jgi:hypothetical protein